MSTQGEDECEIQGEQTQSHTEVKSYSRKEKVEVKTRMKTRIKKSFKRCGRKMCWNRDTSESSGLCFADEQQGKKRKKKTKPKRSKTRGTSSRKGGKRSRGSKGSKRSKGSGGSKKGKKSRKSKDSAADCGIEIEEPIVMPNPPKEKDLKKSCCFLCATTALGMGGFSADGLKKNMNATIQVSEKQIVKKGSTRDKGCSPIEHIKQIKSKVRVQTRGTTQSKTRKKKKRTKPKKRWKFHIFPKKKYKCPAQRTVACETPINEKDSGVVPPCAEMN